MFCCLFIDGVTQVIHHIIVVCCRWPIRVIWKKSAQRGICAIKVEDAEFHVILERPLGMKTSKHCFASASSSIEKDSRRLRRSGTADRFWLECICHIFTFVMVVTIDMLN